MTIIFMLIPLGLTLLAAAVFAFFWAVRSGQFDDMETPAWRILLDDDRSPPPEASAPPGAVDAGHLPPRADDET